MTPTKLNPTTLALLAELLTAARDAGQLHLGAHLPWREDDPAEAYATTCPGAVIRHWDSDNALEVSMPLTVAREAVAQLTPVPFIGRGAVSRPCVGCHGTGSVTFWENDPRHTGTSAPTSGPCPECGGIGHAPVSLLITTNP